MILENGTVGKISVFGLKIIVYRAGRKCVPALF